MFRKQTFIFSILTCLWTVYAIGSEAPETLLLINMKDEAVLPSSFRKAQDAFKQSAHPLPSRQGLDNLKLSGSAQFSEKGLEAILNHLQAPSHFYILDLRQESHGFMNGMAMSWYADKNWINVGKNLKVIDEEENDLLQRALRKQVQSIEDRYKHQPHAHSTASFTVYQVANEQQLAHSYQLNYFRIPVTDHVKPTDDQVDLFVAFVKQLPKEHWLHIHCAAGHGRTTTFMSMYDIMHNAQTVSFDDIMQRQFLIGGFDLKKTRATWKQPFAEARLQFLQDFYNYARQNQDGFATSWSMYQLKKHL